MDIIRFLQNDEALDSTCRAPLSFGAATAMIVIFSIAGIIWSIINYRLVKRIDVQLGTNGEVGAIIDISSDQKELLLELGEKISNVISSVI